MMHIVIILLAVYLAYQGLFSDTKIGEENEQKFKDWWNK